MTSPLRLSADHVVYSFSATHTPALELVSGQTVVIETRDAYDRFFSRNPDVAEYLRRRSSLRVNPATGPIFVQDLQPGDGLDVTIERIELGPAGYVAVVPGIGVLGNARFEPRLVVFDIRPDGLWWNDRVHLPLRPMVGVIGVAPQGPAVPSSELGDHGGNLDVNDITVGATVHLPVNVAGGLLALGDVHASMGDGEVYSGVNTDAWVTVRLRRVTAAGWRRPWLETRERIITVGVAAQVEDAIAAATQAMTELLEQRLAVSRAEAMALTGAACDIRLGQASKFGVKASVFAAFPKSALEGSVRP